MRFVQWIRRMFVGGPVPYVARGYYLDYHVSKRRAGGIEYEFAEKY
jgi:hypothetical protein